MTPTELLFKLKNLPSETPITAEHIIAILGAMQAPQTVNHQAGAYSTWDNDKLINTETLAEWIGEIPSRLNKWRVDGVGPKFISKAKHIAYRVGDVRDWIASRTVQSTTQADRLSFVSAFDDCFVEPTVYHDQQPYSLFESIALFGNDDETTITGFELFITKDHLASLYMQCNFDALDGVENINERQIYFINGIEQQGNLAHVIAQHTQKDMQEWLPSLLNQGLDFSAKDNNGKTAFEHADESIKNYLSKRDLMLKLSEKLETKGKSPVVKE